MTTQPITRAAALAALALFATTASQAQGLGGMLNKAKAGLNSATATTKATSGSPVQAATQAATQTGTGDLPPAPDVYTVASEQAYAHACLNDKRPVLPLSENDNANSPNRYYRELHQEYHMPLTFTWDEAAVQQLIDKRSGMLWSICEDISADIVRGLSHPADAPTLRPLLLKVKQIHLTTSPKHRSNQDGPAMHGYFLSFNPATGVLTAAMSTPDGINQVNTPPLDAVFDPWIMQHVK